MSAVRQTQEDLESRANSLLRKFLSINQPQISDAEDKWFKELVRVKSQIESPVGLVSQAKLRIAEAKRMVELAAKNGDDVGKTKLDARVMETIEEAYVTFYFNV